MAKMIVQKPKARRSRVLNLSTSQSGGP